MSTRLAMIAAGLAGLLAAGALAMAGAWLPAGLALLAGAGWAVTLTRLPRAISPGLAVMLILCAVSAWLSTSAGSALWAQRLLVLAAASTALAAWDLAHFAARLVPVDALTGASALERAHLRRLLPVVVLGFGLGAAGLLLRARLSFAAALLLGLLAVVGVSQVVTHLRRESD